MKVQRPGNVENITTTSYNEEIYKSLSKSMKIMEGKYSSIQGLVAQAACPILKLQDSVCEGTDTNELLIEKSMDSLQLLAGANRALNPDWI